MQTFPCIYSILERLLDPLLGHLNLRFLFPQMELNHVLDRDVEVLSGGELQRFAIGVVAVQDVSRANGITPSVVFIP